MKNVFPLTIVLKGACIIKSLEHNCCCVDSYHSLYVIPLSIVKLNMAINSSYLSLETLFPFVKFVGEFGCIQIQNRSSIFFSFF